MLEEGKRCIVLLEECRFTPVEPLGPSREREAAGLESACREAAEVEAAALARAREATALALPPLGGDSGSGGGGDGGGNGGSGGGGGDPSHVPLSPSAWAAGIDARLNAAFAPVRRARATGWVPGGERS